MTPRHVQRHHGGRRAFTIAEILVALTISSLVGLVVTTMLSALESTVREERDVRRANVQEQMAVMRLGALVRSSARLLALDADDVVLWRGDANGDGQVNVSELRVLRLESSGEVWTFEVPGDEEPALDTAYAIDADFAAVASALIAGGDLPGTLALRHVKSWSVEADQPEPRDATLLAAELALETTQGVVSTKVVAGFRATPVELAF